MGMVKNQGSFQAGEAIANELAWIHQSDGFPGSRSPQKGCHKTSTACQDEAETL